MSETKHDSVKLWDAVPGFEFNEEIDVPALHSWVFDGAHGYPRWIPMFSWLWIRYCSYGGQYGAEMISMPRFKGWVYREKDGGAYIGMRIVRDEAEIEERTARFREAMRPWLEEFDSKWDVYKQELLSIYEPLQAVDLDRATNVDLLHHLWDLTSMYRRMWEIHFLVVYPAFAAFTLLEDTLARFGITSQSPEFNKMIRGVDNEVFQVDKELWELGQKAIRNGIGDVFKDNEATEVLAKLEKTDAGGEWKKDFSEFLNKNGWRVLRAFDLQEPYWLEEPSSVISIIQNFISKGINYNLGKIRANLIAEREKEIDNLMQKVPGNEKEELLAVIKLAQKGSSISEEHDLYCELRAHALWRRGLLGMGRRLAQAGAIDQPEDIFFLNPDEIEQVMLGPEFHKMQYIANRRRAQWEDWKEKPCPPVITDRASIEEVFAMDAVSANEPIVLHVAGVEVPLERPGLKADIRGISASPGEADGLARVIMDYNQLPEVQSGEILVCPAINPAWTPVFPLVKALVTNGGGLLSHAAIVGREYGIPTIVNSHVATSQIKTGQHIRVDGTNGAIYFLDK
jgi:pyruvate,water dikinase